MADIRYPVNLALAAIPVNKAPLIDDTTFKDIEDAVAYNATGLALRWHFVSTDGTYTVAVITPTTGGLYDWADTGDSGIYTVEMPISGGTTNGMNTRTGHGWFTGKATGVLPWSSWVYEFTHANVVAALTDGTEFLETAEGKQYKEITGGNLVGKKRDNSATQFSVPATLTAGADTLTKIG